MKSTIKRTLLIVGLGASFVSPAFAFEEAPTHFARTGEMSAEQIPGEASQCKYAQVIKQVRQAESEANGAIRAGSAR